MWWLAPVNKSRFREGYEGYFRTNRAQLASLGTLVQSRVCYREFQAHSFTDEEMLEILHDENL